MGVWGPPFWASGGGPLGPGLGTLPKPRFPASRPGGCRKPHFSRFGRSQGRPGLGPSKPAQTVQKLTFCGFPGYPRKTQKTGFYDSNFLIRPIACFSGGAPPKSDFFPKKSLFRGSPPNLGLGLVWDRFGAWFGTPPHPPWGGVGRGGKVRFPTPQKLAQNYGQKPTLEKGLVSGPSQTDPPHPPKRRGGGGSVWGVLLGTFGTSKKCPKTSPFFMVGF